MAKSKSEKTELTVDQQVQKVVKAIKAVQEVHSFICPAGISHLYVNVFGMSGLTPEDIQANAELVVDMVNYHPSHS